MCTNKPPAADFCVFGLSHITVLAADSSWPLIFCTDLSEQDSFVSTELAKSSRTSSIASSILCRICKFVKDFFVAAVDFCFDLAVKQNVNHGKKANTDKKKMVELNPKCLDQKLRFTLLNGKQLSVCEAKQTSARRFLVFHHTWLIYLATRFPA